MEFDVVLNDKEQNCKHTEDQLCLTLEYKSLRLTRLCSVKHKMVKSVLHHSLSDPNKSLLFEAGGKVWPEVRLMEKLKL